MMNAPSLVGRVAFRHRSHIMRHGAEPAPDLARLITRLRSGVETGTPDARLQAIAVRARFMLRRSGDPQTEMQDVLSALAWIVEVAEGTEPLP